MVEGKPVGQREFWGYNPTNRRNVLLGALTKDLVNPGGTLKRPEGAYTKTGRRTQKILLETHFFVQERQ